MADKSLMDWYMKDMVRSADLKHIVESSRGRDGRVDPVKAAGIAAGLGFTSAQDVAHLAGHLGAAGAFEGRGTSDNDTAIVRSNSGGKKKILTGRFWADQGFHYAQVARLAKLSLYEDHLEIHCDGERIIIPIETIKNVARGYQPHVIYKKTSPLMRGVLGGLFLGQAGAVLGVLSGQKTRKLTQIRRILTIQYEDRTGERTLVFVEGFSLKGKKFLTRIEKLRHEAGKTV